MRILKSALFGAMALGVSTQAPGQTPPPPCSAAEHRAFDFWIGN
jgi:hypothetical protein